MIRGQGARAAAAGALVLVVVTGCSSAVSGHGSVATPPKASVVPVTSPAPTSSTPSASPTSATPTTSAPTTATPAAVKVCPHKSKPPFCYRLPAGFTDFSSLTTYGKGWKYRTLVSLGRHDLVVVLANRYKNGTDRDSWSFLQSYYRRSLQGKPGKYHVRQAGPAKRVRVDGARAFQQHLVYKAGVHAVTVTVFRGHTVLSLSCQSQSERAEVAAGCARVRSTIHIRG